MNTTSEEFDIPIYQYQEEIKADLLPTSKQSNSVHFETPQVYNHSLDHESDLKLLHVFTTEPSEKFPDILTIQPEFPFPEKKTRPLNLK